MRLLVLGGGPAGLTAALQARELNAQVTLIEADRIGGTSLNRGPAPVRTLARAARLMRDTHAWPTFGLRGPAPEVDLAATLANAGGWPTTPTTSDASASMCAATASNWSKASVRPGSSTPTRWPSATVAAGRRTGSSSPWAATRDGSRSPGPSWG